jgi:hypothetical protein
MRIKYQPRGLSAIRELDGVQSVIIYDDHDNPIYVGRQMAPDTCVHEKAGQPGFHKLLSSIDLGLAAVYKVVIP